MIMRFKEFLVLEFGFSDSGSDWFYGNYLYPSDAFDWPYTFSEPADFKFLQRRWQNERKEGRKFHNLDVADTLDTKFVSVYSNTMPEAGDGFWKHKPDNRPNVTVDRNAPMKLQGHRKSADRPHVLTKSNNLIDKKSELNQLFGKFEPKYAEIPKDFDKPWTNKKKLANGHVANK
jgi:hypothetical protein